ncbi:MAG: hypothetical protein KJ798_11980 [Gammaproteobacteria bacterium]|nr:hypothetical protein [Gammaproteobacteria bacterium]MBU0850418.1 hypothetical protein [Gammaproteobacteria bacterium]MBU1267688.1 hypothetical protein [Gammaproteobacteria bacterium]MBU1528504.1 hypothetical protein [Gammaproteobacteria bacterium]MBU1781087.1 hypothetical protein [Gammaproteobacteria bacterium]
MNQQHKPPETRNSLMPRWALVALLLVALLLTLGYTSPDMRAVYVAAWAACF